MLIRADSGSEDVTEAIQRKKTFWTGCIKDGYGGLILDEKVDRSLSRVIFSISSFLVLLMFSCAH